MVQTDEHREGARPGLSGGRRLRVGVVGTRTVAQGIGAYVARAFASAGCEVVALVGTSPATVAQARADLARRYGLQCAGYLDVGAMLGEQALDVLAICSPPAAHRAALLAALEAGVHVLCEKPLWWEADSARRAGLAAEVEALARGFAERGGCSRSTRSGPPRCRHSGSCTRRPRQRACGRFACSSRRAAMHPASSPSAFAASGW